jgi:dipeptidyl aminopeptidase
LVTVHTFSLQSHLAGAGISQSSKRLSWKDQMPLTKRVIMEVGWLGSEALLIKEVDRSAKKGSVVLFTDGDAEGRVVRVLGKDGEEGDNGWIEHVRPRSK